MELIRGLHNLTPLKGGCVATIGKFDGVHCGHQQILEAVIAKSQALNVPSLVIIFEPDPQEYFSGETAPARLSRFREKWVQFERLGIDKVLCLRFGPVLASTSADEFIETVLIRQLKIRHLIVGDDFRFGANREGNYNRLLACGRGHFSVQTTASIRQGTERISSTLIRERLQAGELDQVRLLLGRNYSISGRVSHGEKIGRTIGFPTLNVPLLRRVSPLSGVYLVKVLGVAAGCHFGVANIGVRPTLGQIKPRLEVHLLNFNQDCYGLHIDVLFLQKLRDEQKFSSLDDLTAQIANDIQQAKEIIQH